MKILMLAAKDVQNRRGYILLQTQKQGADPLSCILERHIILSYGNQAKFMLHIIAVLHADIINISVNCVRLHAR